MSNHKEDSEQNVVTRLRPHAEFKALEFVGERLWRWGWPVITPFLVIWWDRAHHIDRDWLGIALLLLAGFVVVLIGNLVERGRERRLNDRFTELASNPTSPPTPTPQTSGVIPGIPTLSALLGQNPSMTFDAKKFFALAYYSPLTAEIEKNIKIIAQQNSPNDREAFYARFIGVGAIAYQFDVSWFTIFGSQIRAMEEMNSRGLIPITDIKKHYDGAAAKNPKFYATYSFDQWISFMQGRQLIAVYPSQMVELSWGGKDFLKYLAHMAWNTTNKAN